MLHEADLKYAGKRTPGDPGRVYRRVDDTLTTSGAIDGGSLHGDGTAAGGRDRRGAPSPDGLPRWCDHIARMWPVGGVGGNGAFYFHYDRQSRRMIRRYVDADDVRARNRERLAALGRRIVADVPGSAISADQMYRETDLAVDFSEDVAPLPAESIDRIVAILTEAGVTAKVSSIHVNGWFGSYDKLTMSRIVRQ